MKIKSPNKMNFSQDKDSELEQMLDFIIEKSSFMSPGIKSDLLISAFPFLKNQSKLEISNWVINLVNQSLSNFLNPIVERPRLISKKIMGRIMVDQTIQHIHELNFVSTRAKINPITLPRLLIALFSIKMIKELNEIKKDFPDDIKPKEIKLGQKINKNIDNHNLHLSSLESQFPNIVELALDTNFNDYLVLEKTEQQAKGNLAVLDLIYLWKIYISKRSLIPNLKKSLDGGLTLLPMSKLYELFVLTIILKFMKNEIGSYRPENGKTFSFGKNIKLHFNRSSIKMDNNKPFTPWDYNLFGTLRPDFMLECNNRIMAIFDAKYKSDVEDSDYQKMLEYVLCFCGTNFVKVEQSESDIDNDFAKLVGLFFYIGNAKPNNQNEKQINKKKDAKKVITRKSPGAYIEKEILRIPITKVEDKIELKPMKNILEICKKQ